MPKLRKLKLSPKAWFTLSTTFVLLLSVFFTELAATNSRDNRTNAAGTTNVTVSWTDNIRFRDQICLASTSTCQPFRTTTGTSDTWTMASLVNYDLHVDISSDGTNWYGWENQTNIGIDCFGPTTCSKSVSWAQADYILNTTLDNTNHTVIRPTHSFQYTNVPPNTNFSGTVIYHDFDNFGASHTASTVGGNTGPCTINCTVSPTMTISADNTNLSYGGTTTIRWSSQNASSCTISPKGWSGVNGAQPTGSLTSSTTYTGNCTGSGGSVSASVRVNVGSAPPAPSPNPPTPNPPTPNPPTSSPPNSNSSNQTSSGSALKGSKSPIISISANDIVLQSGTNSFLIGGKELEVVFEGTSIAKKIIVTAKNEYFSFSATGLTAGKNYTLTVKGDWLLTQKQVFKLSASGTNLTLQPLKLGDLNNDEKINEADAIEFLNALLGDKFYDLNSDGAMNSFDYSILINNIN